jgi:hypothetical protein
MSIKITYNDGTEELYYDYSQAELGILETVTGCDFAVAVEDAHEIEENGTIVPLGVSWSLSLERLD